MLIPAVFQLSFHANRGSLRFYFHHDGGMRKAQQLCENNTGLSIAEIVGLQTGENKVRSFRLYGSREKTRGLKGIVGLVLIGFDMHSAICAFGKSFTDGLGRARGTGAD